MREVAEVHDLSLLRPKGTVCRVVCRTLLEALDVLEVQECPELLLVDGTRKPLGKD